MRRPSPIWQVSVLALFVGAAGALGQGTFQNLGFEAGSIVPAFDVFVEFPAAFPAWTCTVEAGQAGYAAYNVVALDTSGISIIDHGWDSRS
jgi:hypothetical protein